MDGRRLGYGILLLIAASIVLVIGYKAAPKPSGCNTANSVNARTSQLLRCSRRPATGYLVTAGILGGIGLVSAAPWWLRRLGGGRQGGF
jgi:hypothetical protein